MNVLFIEPPPARRTGGIETALAGLACSLGIAGVTVARTSNPHAGSLAHADAVHFHGLWEVQHAYWRWECRRRGVPFVVSPHGMLEPWAFRHRGWKKRLYLRWLEKPSLKPAQRLHVTSNMERTSLTRHFPDTAITELPLGLDGPKLPRREESRTQLGVRDDERCLVFLSRCHPKKGLHDLVSVLPDVVRSAGGKVRLFIVGSGEPGYSAPLMAQTASWPELVRAEWCGAVWGDAKWRYLVAADLLCLPTYSENFGLAILEALAAGTPVLTTDATPWDEFGAGLPVSLHSPGAEALAAALGPMLRLPPADATARHKTQAAVRSRFEWSVLAPRYAELYRQVAQSR